MRRKPPMEKKGKPQVYVVEMTPVIMITEGAS